MYRWWKKSLKSKGLNLIFVDGRSNQLINCQDIIFLFCGRHLSEPGIVPAEEPGGGVQNGAHPHPPSFSLLIITIITTTAICLPPGGPTGNLTSIQLCCHDLLPWEHKINNWSVDYDGRRGEVWKICVKRVQCINDSGDAHKLNLDGSILEWLKNDSVILSDIPINLNYVSKFWETSSST